jgi:Flp pilus assembly protein TadG
MRYSAIARMLPRHLRRLVRDQRGISAVEFAMLLPLMITLYLGSVEISQGISINRKVTLTARTVTDLVAQVSSINNASMTNVLNASSAVMTPFPVSPLKVTVSLVSIDAQSNATITWSDGYNVTGKVPGSPVTLPAALLIPNTSLVWGEVQYNYAPAIGYVVTSNLTLKDQLYMRPRLSSTITRTVN